MTDFLKEYGEELVRLGYTVLPIKPGTKRPDIKDWPRHATTEADVRAWYSNGRAHHGVGINARNTPAIDVDVLDPAVADAMSRAIDETFPGVALMTRSGKGSKFAVPFRSEQPFKKLTSIAYTDGTNEHKVEVLGDGQQWWLTLYTLTQKNLTDGSMEYLTREYGERLALTYPYSLSATLNALLTHSTYLRPPRLRKAPGVPFQPRFLRYLIEWLMTRSLFTRRRRA